MGSLRNSAFPSSSPPEGDGHDSPIFDDQTSIAELRAALPTVALVIADPRLRDWVAALLQSAGRVAAGEELLPAAVAVVTDAKGLARKTVADLRGRARTDAAIVVLLDGSAPASQVEAAYEAGAVLCLREPLDEHQLLTAIGSAVDLHSAKVHADDLVRQLDVQAHLASLGRVTANFTHELSNPLAALQMNFETIRDSLTKLGQARDLLDVLVCDGLTAPTVEAAREWVATTPMAELRAAVTDVGSALDRINAVLVTVRALARGRLSSRSEDVDLASLVRDVRVWAAKELEGIEVEERVDQRLVARADSRLLGQIVLNLVTNAAHAARELPSPRVRLHVYASMDEAILSVRDNGPGIPAAIRDRIFEPFFTTRRGQGGTGLGLALCGEYAAQIQARITLWTAPGRGSCFRIHLRPMLR